MKSQTNMKMRDPDDIPLTTNPNTPQKIPYVSAVSEPSTPTPFTFDMERPPTPSSAAPANLTNLLSDVGNNE
jgi:hypothetical protein